MEKKLSVITGATGHIGYALLKVLVAKDERVRILIRSENRVFDGIPCEKVFGDVTEPETLEAAFAGADVVYHLAGFIYVGTDNNSKVWDINVQGTKNVVEACKKCGVRRLIYASSVDAMPPLHGDELMTEKADFNPDNVNGVYAKTKAEATRYVLDSANDNFDVIVILPGACIGPYDFKVSSAGEMVRMVMKGKLPVSLGFGGYNFVDVRDVAKGMIGAAEKGRAGECYLLTGEVVTADEIISIISEKSGRKTPRIKLPHWVAKATAPLAEIYYKITGASPLFTRLSIEILNYNCNFCFQKAANDFGYKPMSTKQSISDMVDWIREYEETAVKKRK